MKNRVKPKQKQKSGKSRTPISNYGEVQKYFDMALKQHKAGRLQKAKPLYQKILKIDPDNYDALHMLGLLAHQSGNHETAIELLNKAIKYSQKSPELFTNLGNALQAKGRVDEAISAFQQAIGIAPDFALAHNNLGNAFSAAGKTDEAIASLQKAINLSTNYAVAYYNLGTALHAKGERDKAIEYFRHALALNPDYIDANNNLAILLTDKGQVDEAIVLFKRTLQLDQNNSVAQHMLAALEGKITKTAPPEYVVRLFDGVAEIFDQHLVDELSYKVPQYINSAIRNIPRQKQKDLDVIDLGCGTGLCGALFRDCARTLTGVDLSPKMLAKAKELNLYDELVVGDITDQLRLSKEAYDIILATDVFIYVGELSEVFTAAASALKPGGLFAFSLESEENELPYVLRTTGRYAHSMNYIRDLMEPLGLKELSIENKVLRVDKTNPIDGYICVLGKP